jgi:cytochrome c oxidase subunit I+III
MPRRVATYSVFSGWASLNFDATVGAFVFGPAILLTLLNLMLSYRKNEPCEANPWDAKEMEWTGNYSGTTDEPTTQDKSVVSAKGDKQ